MGVRISCDMLARKDVLASLARSAVRIASSSFFSCCSILRCWRVKTTLWYLTVSPIITGTVTIT